MTINDALLEQIIEGALMASGQTLSVDRIQNLFEEGFEPKQERILIVLERLGEKCENRGYELKKVATGYRFQVKQDISKWVSRLWDEKPQRYSRALLETLSIIAYRQPVTRGEIEGVRGVAVSSHITKTLVEREWIQVVGHRDVPGRPAMYATTKMFLDYFSLESLDQLPTLEEIQEISDANHALELEEKVVEGDFDFSSKESDEDGNDTLESAAQDLAAADALVQSVEDAVFNKPEEDEQQSELELDENQVQVASPEPISSIEQAEQSIAQIDENIAYEQASEEASTIDGEISPDMDDEAMAQATIARMIAEQEALLNEKENEKSSSSGQEKMPERLGQKVLEDQQPVTPAAKNSSVFDDFKAGGQVKNEVKSSSVFDDSAQDNEPNAQPLTTEEISTPMASSSETEDDGLMAAMEEEMMAQLEAEQEALLSEQDSQDEQGENKTLSDLASKFE